MTAVAVFAVVSAEGLGVTCVFWPASAVLVGAGADSAGALESGVGADLSAGAGAGVGDVAAGCATSVPDAA